MGVYGWVGGDCVYMYECTFVNVLEGERERVKGCVIFISSMSESMR